LHFWWLNLSDQLYRRRRERYRVFAARLAKKYGTIFMEDLNLRSAAEHLPAAGMLRVIALNVSSARKRLSAFCGMLSRMPANAKVSRWF
jgi:hypothetical protein